MSICTVATGVHKKKAEAVEPPYLTDSDDYGIDKSGQHSFYFS